MCSPPLIPPPSESGGRGGGGKARQNWQHRNCNCPFDRCEAGAVDSDVRGIAAQIAHEVAGEIGRVTHPR